MHNQLRVQRLMLVDNALTAASLIPTVSFGTTIDDFAGLADMKKSVPKMKSYVGWKNHAALVWQGLAYSFAGCLFERTAASTRIGDRNEDGSRNLDLARTVAAFLYSSPVLIEQSQGIEMRFEIHKALGVIRVTFPKCMTWINPIRCGVFLSDAVSQSFRLDPTIAHGHRILKRCFSCIITSHGLAIGLAENKHSNKGTNTSMSYRDCPHLVYNTPIARHWLSQFTPMVKVGDCTRAMANPTERTMLNVLEHLQNLNPSNRKALADYFRTKKTTDYLNRGEYRE
jgi:hypothetical protein